MVNFGKASGAFVSGRSLSFSRFAFSDLIFLWLFLHGIVDQLWVGCLRGVARRAVEGCVGSAHGDGLLFFFVFACLFWVG